MPGGIDTLEIDCKLLKLFSICLKGFLFSFGLHVVLYNGMCLSVSSLRFSNRYMYEVSEWNLRLPFPPSFNSTYSVVLWCQFSTVNPSNSLFDQQTPKHKADDSKYNYIHFLLLFIRTFSLYCCDPITSSTVIIKICIETRGERSFDTDERSLSGKKHNRLTSSPTNNEWEKGITSSTA